MRTKVTMIEEDFLMVNANVFDRMLGLAVSSGTATAMAGTKDHPGIIVFRDSTTANGAYRVGTETTSLLLSGGEKAVFIFQSVGARSTARIRMGFDDSTNISTQPTDGAWLEIDPGTQVIRGACKNNAGPTYTGTTYTLTINTWYRGEVELNENATAATFRVFNGAGTELWSSTVSANIPNVTGRECGFGAVAGETTTDAAANILILDYMSLSVSRTLVR